MTITRVSPMSVAKISGVLYGLLGLIFGAIISALAMAGAMAPDGGEGGPLGMIFGAAAIVILPLFYGCLGFVMTALMAALFNLAAGWTGGVEIDVR
jgi:hypothetical protein